MLRLAPFTVTSFFSSGLGDLGRVIGSLPDNGKSPVNRFYNYLIFNHLFAWTLIHNQVATRRLLSSQPLITWGSNLTKAPSFI
jgi:hypothetical protein